MKYVFAVKESGERITSYAVGIHGHNIEELQEKVATEYPQALVLQGDDDMQDEFLAGKWFAGGKFFVPEAQPESKSETIANIKAEYEPRFQRLRDAVMQRALMGMTYTDLQAQYKKLTAEMAVQIKGVK